MFFYYEEKQNCSLITMLAIFLCILQPKHVALQATIAATTTTGAFAALAKFAPYKCHYYYYYYY